VGHGRHTISRPRGKNIYFFLQNQPEKKGGRKNCYYFSTDFCKIPYNLIGNFAETCREKKEARTTVKLSALFEKYGWEGLAHIEKRTYQVVQKGHFMVHHLPRKYEKREANKGK